MCARALTGRPRRGRARSCAQRSERGAVALWRVAGVGPAPSRGSAPPETASGDAASQLSSGVLNAARTVLAAPSRASSVRAAQNTRRKPTAHEAITATTRRSDCASALSPSAGCTVSDALSVPHQPRVWRSCAVGGAASPKVAAPGGPHARGEDARGPGLWLRPAWCVSQRDSRGANAFAGPPSSRFSAAHAGGRGGERTRVRFHHGAHAAHACARAFILRVGFKVGGHRRLGRRGTPPAHRRHWRATGQRSQQVAGIARKGLHPLTQQRGVCLSLRCSPRQLRCAQARLTKRWFWRLGLDFRARGLTRKSSRPIFARVER